MSVQARSRPRDEERVKGRFFSARVAADTAPLETRGTWSQLEARDFSQLVMIMSDTVLVQWSIASRARKARGPSTPSVGTGLDQNILSRMLNSHRNTYTTCGRTSRYRVQTNIHLAPSLPHTYRVQTNIHPYRVQTNIHLAPSLPHTYRVQTNIQVPASIFSPARAVN